MSKVTEETVAEAASKMRAEGKMPTHAGIRDIIGGGSFTTISQCLNVWRVNNGEQARLPGRQSIVNDVSVATAAADLVLKGQNPTVAKVRSVLGGGSYSTIAPLLKGWRKRTDGTATLSGIKNLVNSEIPEALRRDFTQLIGHVWKLALEEARSGNEGMRRAIVQAQAELDTARAENLEILDAFEAEIAERDDQIKALRQQLEAMQKLHAV